jgi:hypothetical protein
MEMSDEKQSFIFMRVPDDLRVYMPGRGARNYRLAARGPVDCGGDVRIRGAVCSGRNRIQVRWRIVNKASFLEYNKDLATAR